MNQLLPSRAIGDLPTISWELSPGLQTAMYVAECCSMEPAWLARHISAVVRDEAKSCLARIARKIDVANPERILAWLTRVNLAVSFRLTLEEFELRARAIGATICMLPQAAFTPRTLRLTCLEFKYFPGAKDVHELLLREVATLLRNQRALRCCAKRCRDDAEIAR